MLRCPVSRRHADASNHPETVGQVVPKITAMDRLMVCDAITKIVKLTHHPRKFIDLRRFKIRKSMFADEWPQSGSILFGEEKPPEPKVELRNYLVGVA